MDKLTWSALEYEDKERSRDWFWALGIIVVSSSVAAIIYGNYFFAALLLISGVLLGFFAVKKPEMVNYELNSRGLKIRTELYPYERIRAFWVQPGGTNDKGHEMKPMLFIRSERVFIPEIEIPIEDRMAQDIHSIFSSYDIPEIEMKEHLSMKVMEILGF